MGILLGVCIVLILPFILMLEILHLILLFSIPVPGMFSLADVDMSSTWTEGSVPQETFLVHWMSVVQYVVCIL